MSTLTFRALLLWSLALTLGCSKNAPQAVEKVKAIEEKSTPQVRVTEEDFKILDVVLLDFLDFEGYKILHPTKIVLDPITAGDFDHAQENQLDVEALSARNQDISAELRGDLRRRNPEKPISLAGYKSSSSRILLRKGNLTAPGEEITEAVAYARRFSIAEGSEGSHFVIAWLPGYSKDGNSAIFRAFVGPIGHKAEMTYKLDKKEGKWLVGWRRLATHG